METPPKRYLQGVRSHRGAPAGEYWSFCAAILFVAFDLAVSIYVSSRHLLSFDEIVSVLFGRLPDITVIWKAVGHVDPWGMPPAYYILVHLFRHVIGSAEVSARLPSSLAMAAGLLIVFDCTRRLTDGLHGLIALALLTCSFLTDYGSQARSYALCFMLAALSLWVWIHAASVRRSSAVLFALVFFCGFMMHPYTVLWLVPYIVFELVTWRQGRHPSAKLVGGGIGVLCGVAALSNLILIAKMGPRPFSGLSPSLAAVYNVFPEMFPYGLILLAFVLVWTAIVRPIDNLTPVPAMQDAERVSWLFLLIPPAGYLSALLVTNAFSSRYFIGALPGVAVASTCLVWRHFRGMRLVAVGIVLFFAVVGARHQADALRHPELIGQQRQKETGQVLRLEGALQDEGKEFIVISRPMLFLEVEYYSKHPEKYRFLAPDDPRLRIPVYFAEYYPLKIWSLNDLKAHGHAAAQMFPQPDTLDAMKKAGFLSNVRFAAPIQVVYYQ